MMYTGMLWFDNDAKSELKLRVERAAEYYRRKYGQQPNLCFVHPSMLANREISMPEPAIKAGSMNAGSINAGNVEVRGMKTVLPNHFWIGISQDG
jgi:hypothetical protein